MSFTADLELCSYTNEFNFEPARRYRFELPEILVDEEPNAQFGNCAVVTLFHGSWDFEALVTNVALHWPLKKAVLVTNMLSVNHSRNCDATEDSIACYTGCNWQLAAYNYLFLFFTCRVNLKNLHLLLSNNWKDIYVRSALIPQDRLRDLPFESATSWILPIRPRLPVLGIQRQILRYHASYQGEAPRHPAASPSFTYRFWQ